MTNTVLTGSPIFQAFVGSSPAAGYLLHTYQAGGTTPLQTYQDYAGTTPNANPVLLDSNGTATIRYLPQAYKLVLKDPTDVTTIWSADNFYPPITGQTDLGSALYPPTTAEISAGGVVQGWYGYGIVDRYGVNGIGVDMTAAAQVALTANAGKEVKFLPGSTYLINSTGSLRNQDGGTICLGVSSGTHIIMWGATIKLAASSTVAGSIFGNTAPVTDVQIEGGIIDGNSGATSGQMWGITLWSGIDCDIFRVKVQNINGAGLSHRGQTTLSPPYGRNSIKNCRVENGGFLGIQCAHQTLGVQVIGNYIDTTVDNGIDIEGDLALGVFSVITGITKAASAAVTVSTGGSTNPALLGNEVSFSSIAGMVEMNGLTGTITAAGGSTGAWTFTVNINSSGFTAYASGGQATMAGDGNRCIVSQNVINNVTGDCGIFIESVANVIVTDNTLENLTHNLATGIVLNRTHTGANETLVTGNRIKNLTNNGVGIKFQGSYRARVENNTFKNMQYSIWALNGAEFLSIGPNTHEQISGNHLIQIDNPPNSMVWSHIAQQDYVGARSATTGIPFTVNPLDNVVNHSDRVLFPRGITATWFLQVGGSALAGSVGVAGGGDVAISDLQAEYYDGAKGILTIDGTFAGAYSLFTGGETQIHPTVGGSAWTVGNYIWTQGTVARLYLLFSAIGGGIFTIREPMKLTTTTTTSAVATSATLTANFRGTTGAYNTTFFDGGGNSITKAVTLTNGATTATWTGGIGFVGLVDIYTVAIPGNYTTNITGAHPSWEYYPQYQTD